MGIKDILFGKKAGFAAPDPIAKDIRRFQLAGVKAGEAGLQKLTKAFGADTGQITRAQIAREQRGVSAAKEDASRALGKKVAQRGLGGSSIGLGQEIGLQSRAAQQKAALTASTAGRIQQAEIQAGKTLTSVGRGISEIAPVRFRSRKARRGGGIFSLLTTAVGGALGGQAGAQAGAGIGQGVQGLASQ